MTVLIDYLIRLAWAVIALLALAHHDPQSAIVYAILAVAWRPQDAR